MGSWSIIGEAKDINDSRRNAWQWKIGRKQCGMLHRVPRCWEQM
ncbi:MAG: hypothetical protein V8T85_15840 [Blautia faecicola]